MNDIFPAFLLVCAVALLIIGSIDPMPVMTDTYFDGAVTVMVDHEAAFKSDHITIVFNAEGEYLVTFVPIDSGDSVPSSRLVIVGSEYLPHTEVFKKYSIGDVKVIITKDGMPETHDFITD